MNLKVPVGVFVGILGLGVCAAVSAMEAPVEPPPAEPLLRDRAGYAHDTDKRNQEQFEPTIFTELSPVTIDGNPVRLPIDQRLD